MTNLIQPGITLNDGEVIGSMSDLDCFRQFSFDAATYIDAINADGGVQLSKPKNGNGHNKPIYRIAKIGKIEQSKRLKQDVKRSKAENLALYIKLHSEGKPLPLKKFACEEEGYVDTDE